MSSAKSTRILLTGANGQLGKAIQRNAASCGIDLVALTSRDLDITDKAGIQDTIRHHAPMHIINAAAYTAVDRAEEDSAQAYAVNRDGAANLAEAAQTIGSRMLHVSTDFVFDGEQARPYLPEDGPNPVNVYGASKWAGERAVLEAMHGEALVIRTAWVYSLDGRNFLNTMLRLMNERDELRVVEDQVGTPTSTRSLADVLLRAVEADLSGIHHWTDAGVASWYDFAAAIADEAGRSGILQQTPMIQPVSSSEFPTTAARPVSSTLDKSSLRAAAGYDGRHWRSALGEVLSRAGGGQ